MTNRYIWQPDDVAPFCRGMWVNIVFGPQWTRVTKDNVFVHVHCCIACGRRLLCTCLRRGEYDLLTCLWCGQPWTMTWRKARPQAKRKPAKKRARRSLAAVP